MLSQSTLRPGDVPVALHLVTHPGQGYEDLAAAFSTSTSSAHRAVGRLEHAGLVRPSERDVNREALAEFLVHGIRYAFPPVRGPETRGMPTAWSAPALTSVLPPGSMVVWPTERGTVRGEALAPLSGKVPAAARGDAWLYELLALVDAIRLGQARDRNLAAERLRERLREAPR
jgi:hypothetical protein